MTPNDLLNGIMLKLNAYNSNGIIQNKATEDYKKQIVVLCGEAQRDLIDKCNFLKTYTEILSNEGSLGYRALTLPTDFLTLTAVTDKYNRNRIFDNEFCYLDTSLYVTNNYDGGIKISYMPYGTIVSLSDTFLINERYMNAIIFYCAYELSKEENTSNAQLYLQKYEEEIIRLKKVLTPFQSIRDEYR